MKCDKCGVTDNGTGDWAHVCGPVKVKESGMNERIKELYDQANISYSVYEILKPRDERKSIPDIFAELIVRECASLLKNSTSDKRLNLSPELFKMITNISKAQAEYICEHFGVKE
jgi:hypothetical protein